MFAALPALVIHAVLAAICFALAARQWKPAWGGAAMSILLPLLALGLIAELPPAPSGSGWVLYPPSTPLPDGGFTEWRLLYGAIVGHALLALWAQIGVIVLLGTIGAGLRLSLGVAVSLLVFFAVLAVLNPPAIWFAVLAGPLCAAALALLSGWPLKPGTPYLIAGALCAGIILAGSTPIWNPQPTGRAYHDTYYVVAHLGFIVSQSLVYTMFFALTQWVARSNWRLWEALHAAGLCAAMLASALPSLLLAGQGMPRRYVEYSDYLATLSVISTLAALLLGLLILAGLIALIFRGVEARRVAR